MRKRCTKYEKKSGSQGYNNSKSLFSITSKKAVRRVIEATTERDDILLRLKNYKVYRNNIGHKQLKQGGIFHAKKASLEYLKNVVLVIG